MKHPLTLTAAVFLAALSAWSQPLLPTAPPQKAAPVHSQVWRRQKRRWA